MRLLPADLPERAALSMEVHARPSEPLAAPGRASYVAVLVDADERERETRAELVPAVNLYDVLRERIDDERAYQVARRVILNSSLLHLRSIYPDFKGRNFLGLAQGDAGRAEARLGADFAFADTRVIEMTPEKASFDVVHCRIPATLSMVGASRLASIFCEVDFIYFPIFAGKQVSAKGWCNAYVKKA